jgi:gluconokinase
MAAGEPLTDADRAPWYERMRREVVQAAPPGSTWVLACSALKKAYRDVLRRPNETDVRLVFLDGSYNMIFERMTRRKDHFMREGMLRSQFETLERPDAEEAMIVSVHQSPAAVVDEIIRRL